MKLQEAIPKLNALVGKTVREISPNYPVDMVINKGALGQLLERVIGLAPGSGLKDFEDGELKTNKANSNGSPKETMFITQISRNCDDLIASSPVRFEQSNIFKKIERLVFLPICKDAKDAGDWLFTGCYFTDLNEDADLRAVLEEDYYKICRGLSEAVHGGDGMIHTTNGQLIQIRSKDAKRKNGQYNPIYSDLLGRHISNKNHAFYFKKEFMNRIRGQGGG